MTRVLIAGGGVGGLECALALRASSDPGLEIDLLSTAPNFTYRPWSVTTPFGRGPAVEVDLSEVAADRGFGFHEEQLIAVDTDARQATTTGGERAYDALVLALGARPVSAVEGAFTFGGPQDADELTDLLAEDRLPSDGSVVFVATASAVWSLPAYELALQMGARTQTGGHRLRVALVTAEATPLQDFGSAASRAVSALLAHRGVELHTSTSPDFFDGSVLFAPMQGSIAADVVVALPALVGRHVPGVPHGPTGFTPVDGLCRVEGVAGVFAIGDMTDRPLKQGGLTAQQADTVAAVITDGAESVAPYEPILRAMLLTGDQSLHLRYPPGGDAHPSGAGEAPWWPDHKIVGFHLGPYLATHAELLVTPSRR